MASVPKRPPHLCGELLFRDTRVGIIGGTGLESALGALAEGRSHELSTPFGRPSGPIVTGEVEGVPVALLARHGPGHLLNPSQVPYRANIFAMKMLGVTHLLATGAVGSLREKIRPGELLIPDQVIDRTFRRATTFFDDLAVHVELASPFCPTLRAALIEVGKKSRVPVHRDGTYLAMEGPQFSTRAESELHRAWGADLVGMTAMPEAKLAREAELCYAMVALVTDYDCWRPPRAAIEQQELLREIIGNLERASANAIALIRKTLRKLAATARQPCRCQSALTLGIWSDRERISQETRDRLGPLLARH